MMWLKTIWLLGTAEVAASSLRAELATACQHPAFSPSSPFSIFLPISGLLFDLFQHFLPPCLSLSLLACLCLSMFVCLCLVLCMWTGFLLCYLFCRPSVRSLMCTIPRARWCKRPEQCCRQQEQVTDRNRKPGQ